MGNEFTSQSLAEAFAEHRARLMSFVERRLNPILLKRMSAEDVLQTAYLAAAKRLEFFEQKSEVPIYFKLRTILVQAIADIERKNLQAARRDVYKEVAIDDKASREGDEIRPADLQTFNHIAADVTSPASRVDRDERHRLLRSAIASLAENDREIIVLRHFDGMGNSECAAVLGIDPKAASIRYVRALERLQQKLMEVSCFKKTP